MKNELPKTRLADSQGEQKKPYVRPEIAAVGDAVSLTRGGTVTEDTELSGYIYNIVAD